MQHDEILLELSIFNTGHVVTITGNDGALYNNDEIQEFKRNGDIYATVDEFTLLLEAYDLEDLLIEIGEF